MSELPKSWTTTSLYDLLIALESGSRPRGGVRGINGGIPSVGGEHLNYNGGFDFGSVKYVPVKFADLMTKGHIRPNDILIVKDGATTGKTSFVGADFPYKKAVVNEHVFICRTTDRTNSRFLFRYLMSKEGQDRILENFKGSAQGGINQTFAPNTAVPLAPLPEQKRIVTKLEQLLERVERSRKKLERIPKLLKRFRQSVLAAACSGKLTEDWREENEIEENAVVLLDRIVKERKEIFDKEYADYKKGKAKKPDSDFILEYNQHDFIHSWATAKLDNLIYIAARIGWRGLKAEEYTKEGPLFLAVYALNYGEEVDYRDAYRISKWRYEESPEIQLQENDILLCKDGAGIGKLGIITQLPEKATVNSSLLVIRGREPFIPKFLFYFLCSPKLQSIAKERITGSATPHLFQKDIRELYLDIPPIEEQQEIIRRVEQLFTVADKIEQRYTKAAKQVEKLTQSILAKAFRGELVPQDPNDPPASELLAKIKEERELAQVKTSTKRKKDFRRAGEPASVLLERIKIEKTKMESEKASGKNKEQRRVDEPARRRK
ncbi:MAG: restriction endonuclease [Chlorobiaceae bacterium]|nr:restriction endonuclease [Chlorobiaceae bacterium]